MSRWGGATDVDIALRVGNVAEEVTVMARAPLIEPGAVAAGLSVRTFVGQNRRAAFLHRTGDRKSRGLLPSPARLGGVTRDGAPSLRAECGGASGAALETAEPSQCRRVWVGGARPAIPLEHLDSLGWRMASPARNADGLGILMFFELGFRFTDEAAPSDAQYEFHDA